eukprot:NODE_2289_length_1456_cov_110.602401_g2174_i0.p2 GENE.NODE_2289_length_1456_cov_110.602401_g2174_i0~~NODE_2289_length_1456_cov_110.602401_g2174_i0.p2  ORF type:complete len:187 (+),score=22.13 NODE_2289_length_1456_cov_110.602401_g2174_i0:821-1381(+)
MLGAQFVLLHACTRYPSRGQRGHRITDVELRYFWMWEDLLSYIASIILICAMLLPFVLLLRPFPMFIEVLGFLSLSVESTLAMPQFVENFRRRSTEGLSYILVATWCIGDVAKTVYFIATLAPAQFTMCGVLQMGMDVAVVTQMACYRSHPHRKVTPPAKAAPSTHSVQTTHAVAAVTTTEPHALV